MIPIKLGEKLETESAPLSGCGAHSQGTNVTLPELLARDSAQRDSLILTAENSRPGNSREQLLCRVLLRIQTLTAPSTLPLEGGREAGGLTSPKDLPLSLPQPPRAEGAST